MIRFNQTPSQRVVPLAFARERARDRHFMTSRAWSPRVGIRAPPERENKHFHARRRRSHASASSSRDDGVVRTVANDRELWLESWFACENPAALRVLAGMPVAQVNARRIGALDPVSKVWICGGATLGTLSAGARGVGGDAFVRELWKVAGVEHFAVEDDDGRLPLHHAAAFGREEIVRALVELGCDIDARDESEGSTALILAAYFERADAVDALLDLGADFSIRDDGNVTVGGHLAQRKMRPQLLRVMKESGPGGPGRLKRGDKSYLVKRRALQNELSALDVDDLLELSRHWGVRGAPAEKKKLIEALLARTP